MVASEFLGYIQSFSACTYVGVEDLADRANFQWNVIVLLICMMLVTVKQYFMSPLVCYFPTTLSGSNAESYVTNMCWVEGTYPMNLTSGVVPTSTAEWDNMSPTQMNYYQWVPLVLGLQAILFYLPRIVWSIFIYNRTGTDLENLVKTAFNASKEEGEKREKAVKHIAKSLEVLLFSRREYRQTKNVISQTIRHTLRGLPGKRHGNNLVYMYLFIKVLYVVVGLLELFIMYVFLRFDTHEGYFWFGFRILHDIVSGKPWTQTQVFPRIGMCRHDLKNVASDNRLWAQCVLPINMLNEKIYVFLYFFISAVVMMTVLSIPLWLVRMGLKSRQKHFVRRFLKIADHYDRKNMKQKDLIDKFITEFLRQDGHFILRMLSMNAGDLITVEIVCHLFSDYQKQFLNKDFRGEPLNRINDYSKKVFSPLDNSPPCYHTDKSLSPQSKDFMQGLLNEGPPASAIRRVPNPSAPPNESEAKYTQSLPISYPLEISKQRSAYPVSIHSDDSNDGTNSQTLPKGDRV